ncbi:MULTISPECIES: hypothetical protein [unclassified Paraburkholderia]|uniref:COG4648 family protein n=1 Tax=unclassified Paraburkholderia TaxID=2615204 RepID=UPI002AB30545|nr:MULTISPECIES: hypothetical protein [unclassified Paraburkholderia]
MSAGGAVVRTGLGIAAVIAYQVLAHHAVATPGEQGLGLAMALIPPLLLALGAAAKSPRRAWLLPLWVAGAGALWVARTPLAQQFEWGLYIEHASFNLGMALLFGRTLVAGRTPLCTQFASMLHTRDGSALAPAIARYTRQITLAWTLFFVATAAVSTLMFAFAPIVDWATFANYLALPLVGVMFVAEHACRRFALPGERRAGMMESVRAYRASSGAANAGRT